MGSLNSKESITKIKTTILKIVSWILVILSVPFLLVSTIDFIKTRESIDIFIFVVFFIPFIIGVKLMYSCKRTRRNLTPSTPNHKHDVDSLKEIPKERSENGGGCPNCSLGINTPPTDNYTNLQTTKSNTTQEDFSSAPQIITNKFPDWHVSVSFGKSSSDNYMKAVALAKAAPQYHEQNDNGNILHQAIYSSKPDEYLAFIMLYELVENWKSSFAIINGKLIDRKVIKQLNYCYGDNCRSGNPKFCYGASYMTDNPFGCHRLQISACNHPWWSFYKKVGRRWILDKSSLLERIDSYAAIYSLCPMFDYEHILKVLNQLPSSLSESQYQSLIQKSSQTIYIDF